MNELKIFENPDFGQVRIVMIEDTPYFVGKDVAEVLGYEAARNAIAMHVDNEDKLTHQILTSPVSMHWYSPASYRLQRSSSTG